MKIKNQKGISLVTLSVAIVILVIITSVLVYNAKDGARIKNLEELYNDIELLNDKVSSYYLEYGDIPTTKIYADAGDTTTTSAFLVALGTAGPNGESVINPNDGNIYYVIDLAALEGVSLNLGRDYEKVEGTTDVTTLTDLYVINKVSHTIYYVQGITVEDVTYYTDQTDYSNVDLSIIPIYTAEQLAKIGSGETIAIDETGGGEYTFALDGTYLLKNDIDLSTICYKVDGTTANDKSWTPIGTTSAPFTGTFYGNGYTISNIYINATNDYQGLFGYIENATVQDLSVTGNITSTGSYLGGFVGCCKAFNEIINCYNYAKVTGYYEIGGIVGRNYGEIINCHNMGVIEGTVEKYHAGVVGGVAGVNYSGGEIIKSSNSAAISGKSNCVGGIVGTNGGKTIQCCNLGTVTNGEETYGTGGIAGYQDDENSIIQNCYNAGVVKGYGRVGGIQGHTSLGQVVNSYNIQNVTGVNNNNCGGVVGTNQSIITNCYYLNMVAPNLYGSNTGTIDTLSSSKTTEEMRSSEFVDLLNTGNDEPVWVQDTKNINNGYPILAWQLENK